MIEDKALEKMIKDRIKHEKIDFPQKIDNRIKSTIEELPERNARKFTWKWAVSATSFALIIMVSIAAFNYMNAKKSPAKGNYVHEENNNEKIISKQELVEKFKTEGYVVEGNIAENDNNDEPGVKTGFSASFNKVRSYGSLEELVDASDIIVRGEAIAVKQFENEGLILQESKVLVNMSYNTNVKAGEVVTFCEMPKVIRKNDKQVMECSDGIEPMKPGEKVVLFGKKDKDTLIKGTYYHVLGIDEGKFIIKNDDNETIMPAGNNWTNLNISFNEFDSKVKGILQNNKTTS